MNAPGNNWDGASLHDIAHTKRFLERLQGDPGFRREARGVPSARQGLLETVGIELRATDLQPFWELLDARCDTEWTSYGVLDRFRQQPLGELWDAWTRNRFDLYKVAESERVPSGDQRLRSWRRRRLATARSESISGDEMIVSPLLAFELSKGCSTQCWFCAWDPPRLQSYLPCTPENRRLWSEVLSAAWDLFGPGCRTAICYHATEPTDNPDYWEFVRDVREVFGAHPHTTVARPLKDLAWTREMLRLRNASPGADDRFSILTLTSLHEVHATFPAEVLLHVSLVLQNKGALTSKGRVGRTLAAVGRLEAEESLVCEESFRLPISLRTIECTCGYLVNMVDQSVRLISPCNASARWPLGYIVHAEGTFRDAVEFRDVILRSIDECMRDHLAEGDRLAFREDLAYHAGPDGFVLTSAYREHAANGNPHIALLGELVRGGHLTTGQVTERLIRDGMSALKATSWLQRLYQGGLLADAGTGTS
jgi:radical SAM family RiPP maturation amino acid epimerase